MTYAAKVVVLLTIRHVSTVERERQGLTVTSLLNLPPLIEQVTGHKGQVTGHKGEAQRVWSSRRV